jgi:hypothetical protein
VSQYSSKSYSGRINIMEWVALVLFLLMVLSWIALPDSKKATSEVELTSVEFTPVKVEKV